MRDPYEVLGVQPNASDSEIKKAYHELVKKYHPDNYSDNPLADLAQEKMKEINEAYDAITKSRAGGGSSYSGGNAQQGRSSYGYQSYASGGQFQQVRSCINSNRLDEADAVLEGISDRTAEWYFLRGEVAYRRGWLDEARQNYQLACSMAPGNQEYRRALSVVQGGYTPYRQNYYGSNNSELDTACSVCNTLLCLNCLCGGCR